MGRSVIIAVIGMIIFLYAFADNVNGVHGGGGNTWIIFNMYFITLFILAEIRYKKDK